MVHFSTLRRAFNFLAIATLVAGSFGPSRPAGATEVVPLSLTETVRQAQTVIVGRVESQNTRWGTEAKRWMQTDYTIAVEEVVAAEAGTEPIGRTVVVTYWGGTLDGQTQAVADCRLPRIGERLIFILADGWQRNPGFSPVVGFNYGLLSIAVAEDGERAIVRDANGTPLVRRDDSLIGWRGASPVGDANSVGVELSEFINWVRTNFRAIKAAPSELPPQSSAKVDANDPRALPMFSKTPHDPALEFRLPALVKLAAAPDGVNLPSESPIPPMVAVGGSQPDYGFTAKANRPITVNNFRSTITPWSPVDQNLLANWNQYTDIYRIATNPTGSYAWGDNVFDLSGFPTSSQLQATYGQPWPSSVIAYCFSNTVNNVIVESDIALNPAFTFTLDDESVYNGGSARSFRQVMMHEMGHMWGLNHNFDFPSIMNDSQDVFRFFGFQYMDDAEATRAAYPSAIISRTDLAIYLRYSTGTQSITDASYPGIVAAGNSFTVSNYHVENVGSTTIATPTVEWYLTTARNFGTSYFLGSTTYGSLARFQYHAPSNVARSLTVPANVPVGLYYLAAFIRNDSSPQQTTFPFNNDSAFSRTRMSITQATGSLQVTINPAGAVSAGAQWQVDGGTFQNSGATVSGLAAGNHTVAFKPITAWSTPSNQTVTVSANSTATASGTYVVQSGSLQVTINPAGAVSAGAQWQVDGGAFQNSGTTLSNLYVGTHTLTFKPISGWSTPSSQSITVNANATSTASGSYDPIASTGSLQVTISPAGAVSAGAQWQVDGGAFQNSGTTVSNLSVGNHTLAFKAVSGWTAPSSQAVTISANTTTTASGTYVVVASTGALQVTILPAGAVSAGAQWQVDGGAFQNSGVIVSNLSVGNHTISFKPISGWTAPTNQIMPVTAGTTNSTSGTYVAAPVFQLLSGSSIKTHGAAGTYGINLPLTGTPGVECRYGGAGSGFHSLAFTFSNNIATGSPTVTAGNGVITSSSVSGNVMTVNVAVTNAQRLTIDFSGVTDNGGQVLPTTPVTISFLVGDTNGNGLVNGSDIGQVKAASGQAVTSTNYRLDLNVSGGSIGASDIGLVKSASGTQLP